MSGPGTEAFGRTRGPVQLLLTSRPPLGLVFAACFAAAGAGVRLLHLDRLPFVLCTFKQLTGLPCPTCGGTRALGRIAELDLAGAVAMNPLAAALAAAVALWAVADLVLLPRRLSPRLSVRPGLAGPLRVAVVLVAAANWAYLVVAGR